MSMDSSYYRVLRYLCLSLVLFWPSIGLADSIGLVATDASPRTQKFHAHLVKLLPDHQITLVQAQDVAQQRHDRWVSINPKALIALATHQSNHPRVLALFLKDSQTQKIRADYPKFKFTRLDNGPSIARQLSLIKALKPQAGQIGIFYSDISEPLVAQAKQAASKLGMEILATKLDDPLNWDRAALRVLKQSDVVLGVNDESIYNATNIRSILMRLYRANRPLIGPDKPYVRAGAVASTYSGISDTLEATAELLNSKESWPSTVSNQHFRVSVNRQVARSLQISLDEEANLKKKVEGGAP